MNGTFATQPQAVYKIPTEIWLRISLAVAFEKCKEEVARSHLKPCQDYHILPPILTPGSAPITPLGPISSSNVGEVGLAAEDYFGTLGRDAPGFVIASHEQSSRDEDADETMETLAEDTIRNDPANSNSSRMLQPSQKTLHNSATKTEHNKIDSDMLRSQSVQVLRVLSNTCTQIRRCVWPLVVGRFSINRKTLFELLRPIEHAKRGSPSPALDGLRGYVRNLHIDIEKGEPFRAVQIWQLLQSLGEGLNTLVFQFCGPTTVPPAIQFERGWDIEGSIHIPNLSRLTFPAPAEPPRPLLPFLHKLHVVSPIRPGECAGVVNLGAVLPHCPNLIELKITGVAHDLEQLANLLENLNIAASNPTLESLEFNLSCQKSQQQDHLRLALEWFFDSPWPRLTKLRRLSIESFGGMLSLDMPEWKLFAACIRQKFPNLESLTLPIRPWSSADIHDEHACQDAVKCLLSTYDGDLKSKGAQDNGPPTNTDEETHTVVHAPTLTHLKDVRFKVESRLETTWKRQDPDHMERNILTNLSSDIRDVCEYWYGHIQERDLSRHDPVQDPASDAFRPAIDFKQSRPLTYPTLGDMRE